LTLKQLAILIPANPLSYPLGSEERDRADVHAHKMHADEHGFVYWNVPASGMNHQWIDAVKTFYFVQPGDESPYNCNKVIYKGEIVKIEHFKTKNDMRARLPIEEVNYLYGTRRKVWELERNGGYDWKSWPGAGKWGFIFFKMRNIRKLKQRHNIEDFKRAFGMPNKCVERCQKYVIVFDDFFE